MRRPPDCPEWMRINSLPQVSAYVGDPQAWDLAEVDKLMVYRASGLSFGHIAQKLRRSTLSCENKYLREKKKLGGEL